LEDISKEKIINRKGVANFDRIVLDQNLWILSEYIDVRRGF